MHDYILSCCSPADLTQEKLDSMDVRLIYSDYTMDGVPYKDDLGKTMSSKEFYDRIRKGEVGTTTLINTADFVEYFTKLFETENKDVLHVTLSSGLSGTFQAALAAADIMKERFPARRLFIVDSRGASSGFGFLMQALCDLRDEGKTIDELYDWALKNRLRIQHLFCSTTLTYYMRGGRISPAAGRIGNLLGICPVMRMDHPGHLAVHSRVRTKKRALRALVDQMEALADDGAAYSGRVFISHSDCLEDAVSVKAQIQERFKNIKGEIEMYNIGAIIGCHSGPGTVAVFFFGKER
ncbi:MAG: DegV family protein [Clostridia bacterium]|nr:DegV family protein [Clostridia bacterium]